MSLHHSTDNKNVTGAIAETVGPPGDHVGNRPVLTGHSGTTPGSVLTMHYIMPMRIEQ